MKRYVILTQYEATPKAKAYGTPDASQTWFGGVGGRLLNTTWEKHMKADGSELQKCDVIWFGYKSKSGAARGLKAARESAEWEAAQGEWNITCSLVEIEIDIAE